MEQNDMTDVLTKRRITRVMKEYNVSEEEAIRLLKVERCEICGANVSFKMGNSRRAIDHDHVTGKVRGVLCAFCNRALLGNIEAASVWCGVSPDTIMQWVSAYLRRV